MEGRDLKNKMKLLDQARSLAKSLTLTSSKAKSLGLTVKQDGQTRTALDFLSFNDINMSDITQIWPKLKGFDTEIKSTVSKSAEFALESDLPDQSELQTDIYL